MLRVCFVQLSSVVAEIRGVEYMTGNQDAGSRYPPPRIISQLPSSALRPRLRINFPYTLFHQRGIITFIYTSIYL